jgi:hypothetical protein
MEQAEYEEGINVAYYVDGKKSIVEEYHKKT